MRLRNGILNMLKDCRLVVLLCFSRFIRTGQLKMAEFACLFVCLFVVHTAHCMISDQETYGISIHCSVFMHIHCVDKQLFALRSTQEQDSYNTIWR